MIHQTDIAIQREFISAAFELGSLARDHLPSIPREWFTDHEAREARDAILADHTLDSLGYAHRMAETGKFDDKREALTQFPAANIYLPKHIEHAKNLIRDGYVRHKVECFHDVVSRAAGADLTSNERIALLESSIAQLRQSSESGTSSFEHIQVGAIETYGNILEVQRQLRENLPTKSIPTGIDKLDAYLFSGGLRAGQIVLVGARPGVGKSSFMLNCAINQARAGYTVGIVSLEMTRRHLAEIVAQIEADCSFHPFYRNIMMEWEEKKLESGITRTTELPIWVDDSSRKNVEQVVSRLQQMVHRERCDIVYVDYAQRIAFSGRGDAVQELNHISERLTECAKELSAPVVVLAQLNRDAGNAAPELKHFKGSGQFEQDAHIALLLHRPNADKEGAVEDMEIHLAKQRRGVASAFVTVRFDRSTQRIY